LTYVNWFVLSYFGGVMLNSFVNYFPFDALSGDQIMQKSLVVYIPLKTPLKLTVLSLCLRPKRGLDVPPVWLAHWLSGRLGLIVWLAHWLSGRLGLIVWLAHWLSGRLGLIAAGGS
jgi:hypothetical protein